MQVRHILIPVDFSAAARDAAAVGVGLARLRGARVTLLHVDSVPELSLLSAEPFYIPPQAFELLQRSHGKRIERQLAELAGELGERAGAAAVDATTHTASDVVGGITGYARGAGVDLIVVGSRGMTAATRLLLGSVAAKVSRTASCPVLVVGPGEHDPAAEPGFSRALVGVDYSRFSVPTALAAAALLAPGGSLDCVHVWQEPPLLAVDRTVENDEDDFSAALERARAYEVQRMRGFVANCQPVGVDVTGHVDTGSPALQLLERAGALGADLIAVGAHSAHGVVERVIGTVADRILRHAEVPVLLIPPDALPSPRAAAPA